MDSEAKFPSQLKVLRSVAVLLDMKQQVDVCLDEKLRGYIAISIEEIRPILKSVTDPLGKQVSLHFADLLNLLIESFITDYTRLLVSESVEGIARNELEDLLGTEVLPELLQSLFYQLHNHFYIPLDTLFDMCSSEHSALHIASKWIGSSYVHEQCGSVDTERGMEEDEAAWMRYARSKLKYDDGATNLYTYHIRQNSKHAGQNLPSQATINRLFPLEEVPCHPQRPRYLVALTVARVVEKMKRKKTLRRSLVLAIKHCFGNNTVPFPGFSLRAQSFRERRRGRYSELLKIWSNLEVELSLERVKDADSRERSSKLIECSRQKFAEFDSENYALIDRTELYEARFHVLSGNLSEAIGFYKRAIDLLLYRDGPCLEQILPEALCVAARYEKNQNVFLKKLKKIATSYCIDGVAVHDREPFANSADDHLVKWEVQGWKAEFQKMFQSRFMFDCFNLPTIDIKPWFLKDCSSVDELLDTRSPNARVTRGSTITVTKPKLIISVETRDAKTFGKLLGKGAKVDVWDDNGRTPLTASLTLLNPFSSSIDPADEYFFEIISAKEHCTETLLSYDHISLNTALGCAIETGKHSHVVRVLEMMQHVDDTGTKCVDLVNKPVGDSRNTPLCHTLNLIEGVTQQGDLHKCQQHAFKYDLEELRAIAKQLLSFGADPHARMKTLSPTNYSAFWFAIELDEANILEYMLNDVNVSEMMFVDLNQRTALSSLHFAMVYSSANCFRLIQKRNATVMG